jgi:phage gp16-like protein
MTSSIAAIHVAKKQLGLDDDTYRAKLMKITGESSVKNMSEAQRQKVLTVFRNEGFAPAGAVRRPSGAPKLTGKYAKKLQALWIAGYNLGIVRDRDDAALVAFIKRQTGIEHERWLRFADDARKVIEALKGWIDRETGTGLGKAPAYDWLILDGAKIAWAQWRILNPGADKINRMGFDAEVFRLIDIPNYWLAALTDSHWIVVMNALGKRVRAMKGGA